MFPALSPVLASAAFWMFGGIAVACALGLLVARQPIRGAINLIGVMLSLAGLYAVLHSPFVAVIQVLVYAGAIMMLVVFVIMVLNQAEDHGAPFPRGADWLPALLPIALAVVVGAVVRRIPLSEGGDAAYGGIERLGERLFATGRDGAGWWILFELGGLLLLTAIVGAILLAKRRLDTPGAGSGEDAAPSGHPGHAERGSARAEVHDRAAAAAPTTVGGGAP